MSIELREVTDDVREELRSVRLGEGPGGPGGFYRGLGFVPTGDVDHEEIVARLPIS